MIVGSGRGSRSFVSGDGVGREVPLEALVADGVGGIAGVVARADLMALGAPQEQARGQCHQSTTLVSGSSTER